MVNWTQVTECTSALCCLPHPTKCVISAAAESPAVRLTKRTKRLWTLGSKCLTHPCNNIIPSVCVPQSDWLVAALVKLARLQGNPSPDFSSGLDPKAMWEMAPFSKLGECFHTWGKEWLDMAWFLASQRNELEGEGGPRTSAHSSAAYSVLLSRSVNKRERGNVGSTFRAKRCKLSEVTTAWAEAGRVCGFFTCGPSHGCCWAHGHCPATRNLQDWVSWAGVSKAKCSVLVCPGF